MATPFKWNAAPVSFSLFTGAAAINHNAISGESASFAGNTSLNDYGWFEIDTATWTIQPSEANPILIVYRRVNMGSGQVDAPNLGGAQQNDMICSIINIVKTTSAQRVASPPFLLYPVAQTFYVENQTGQILSLGWNLTLWHGSKGLHTP